jgi:hypothetical protein
MEAGLFTLGGVIVGSFLTFFLTKTAQQEHWLRDCRKEEFKEAVTAMSRFVVEHMSYAASQGSKLPQSEQVYLEIMKATSVVLCDRIYIHDDLDGRNIPKRFLEIMEHFRDSGTEFDAPADKASELLEELIAIARKG